MQWYFSIVDPTFNQKTQLISVKVYIIRLSSVFKKDKLKQVKNKSKWADKNLYAL